MAGTGREKGSPKVGGRKKGSTNKVSWKRAAAKIVAASGTTPLEFMLMVMRDENEDIEVRLDAAKGAAPYVHPKIAPKFGDGDDTPLEIVHQQFMAIARKIDEDQKQQAMRVIEHVPST